MDVKMPKLGESVHEGTIEQWLVSEGIMWMNMNHYEVVTDKSNSRSSFNYFWYNYRVNCY